MSDTPEHESHRRPHAPPTAGPFMEFDLPAEIHRLHAETTWSTGQNARTLIKYDDFRVVLTALQASTRVPEHKTEGRISVHVLSGHIQVRASGRTFSLRPGGLLALDQGVPHDIEALEESAFLLTIAWPDKPMTRAYATITGVMGIVGAVLVIVLTVQAGEPRDLRGGTVVARRSTRRARAVFGVGAARRKK